MKVKSKRKFINLFFYMLTALLIGWTASLDVKFIQRVIPESPITAYFGLILFDGGMLAWLMIYLHKAQGSLQRYLAFGLTILSLLGIAVVSAAELIYESKNIITFDLPWMGNLIVIVITVWTVIMVAATIVFHLFDPEVLQQTAIRSVEDEVFDVSLEAFRKRAPEISAALSQELTEVMLTNLVKTFTNRVGEEGGGEFDFVVTKHRRGASTTQTERNARRQARRKQRKAEERAAAQAEKSNAPLPAPVQKKKRPSSSSIAEIGDDI